MSKPTCSAISGRIEGYVRCELSGPEHLEVEGHLLGCAPCRSELEQSRRAVAMLAVLRGEEFLSDVPEPRLRVMRTRILAAAREDLRAREERPGWFGLSWGLAFGALLTIGLLRLGGAPLSPAPQRADRGIDRQLPGGDPVSVITLASARGVTLKWSGEARSYVVTRHSIGAGFDLVQTSVVCGTSWTDPAQASGLVEYQVAPAGSSSDQCRS